MNFESSRRDMVQRQIAARGVVEPAILEAMEIVPREQFLPVSQRAFAYEDIPLPIGKSQTISQPYVVALMIEALGLKGGERILEIGTGSGYAAAVLAHLGREVFTVERVAALARTASATLARLRFGHVHVRCGDGTLGWPEKSPFDAILVSAGGPCIPESLKHQLAVGGVMVIPVGSLDAQTLKRIVRTSHQEFEVEDLADVRFVRLIGNEGWSGPENNEPSVEKPGE